MVELAEICPTDRVRAVSGTSDLHRISVPRIVCDVRDRLETTWDRKVRQKRHTGKVPREGADREHHSRPWTVSDPFHVGLAVLHRFANPAVTFSEQQEGARTLIIKRARAMDFWQTSVPPCAPGTKIGNLPWYGGARFDHQGTHQEGAPITQTASFRKVHQRVGQTVEDPREERLQYGRKTHLSRVHQTDSGNEIPRDLREGRSRLFLYRREMQTRPGRRKRCPSPPANSVRHPTP